MSKETSILLLFMAAICVAFLLFGILFLISDIATKALCYFENGGIYLCKSGKRLSDDTPENRRRFSKHLGFFVIGFDVVFCLLGIYFFSS